MPALRIDWTLRRTWVAGRRLHHGLVGLGLTVAGIALALHDRRDLREWWPARENTQRPS